MPASQENRARECREKGEGDRRIGAGTVQESGRTGGISEGLQSGVHLLGKGLLVAAAADI